MRRRGILVVPIAAVAAVLVFAVVGSGASLPGSVFEIDQPSANLVVDTTGNLDWMNVVQNRRADAPTGVNDDSYQGGTKEDTVCPGEVTGSIPNNKSDLLEFGGYFESEANGPGFLHVYWARVNDPSGTTNMDFEFNRSTTACASGPNVVRTVGDVLLQFDVDQGGAQAHLSRRTWTANGWSDATALTANEAIGSINQAPILAANSDGLITSGSLAPRTFGEASFDLSSVTGGDSCVSFGSAMLKSRSSDSFTSQLKDFIRPISLSSNNCGAIAITKTTKVPGKTGAQPQAGVAFSIDGVAAGTTGTDGKLCVGGLSIGSHTVLETVPSGYQADGDNPKTVNVTTAGTCTSGATAVSFTNSPLTDVTISVDSKADGGTASTVTCDDTSLGFTTGANGDGTDTSDVVAGSKTITCTIVIDP